VVAVQTEPAYVQKGVEIKGTVQAQGQNIALSSTQKISFIQIPVLIKVKLPTGSGVRPYAFAGPNIGITLSAKSEDEIGGQKSETDTKSTTSSTDFALDFGAGVSVEAAPKVAVTLDGRYSLGLSNLDNSPGSTQKIKSTGIQFAVGVMFAI
jgi:opacity protein-like surface antigen